MVDVGICATPEQEEFVAQPFVCGALGPDEQEFWPELLAASPADVTVLKDIDDNRFAASRSPGLESSLAGWCWGRYINRTARPTDVSDAAHELGLAGYWVTSHETVVHVDGLGFHDIFVRTIGKTTYFSNRLTPLASLGMARLHVNWEGWFSCFFLKMFSGAATPFAEITRLCPGERLVLRNRQVRREKTLADWLTSPSDNGTCNDLIEVLMNALPRHLPVGGDLTLSGGLDSRLILAVLLEQGQSASLRTWSTFHEDGTDSDMRIAKQIATEEQLSWKAIDYSKSAWRENHDIVVRRLEHMTAYHGWYMPLARAIHRGTGPLLDGLGGDVVLRYHDRVPAGRQYRRSERIWSQLGGDNASKDGVLHPQFLKLWADRLFEKWREETACWDDHLYSESLMRLFTRTRTGIAAAPFRLFGPERQVLTPFIDPAVVRVALSTPPLQSYRDRDLRPRLLANISPSLSSVESTSALTGERRWQERGRTDAISISAFAGRITASPTVSGVFADGFFDKLADAGKVSGQVSFTLRIGAMMAEWLTIWEDKLY